MYRTENYKCEKCGHIHEMEGTSYEDFPKRKDCPECLEKESCYKMWQMASIHIPEHMKATTEGSGLDFARTKLKKYKGINRTDKRFY